MTKTILIYNHTRNIFTKNEFKPFVKKFFKDVKYLGASGNWDAQLQVSNWNEVKDILPKSYQPIEVKSC